MAGPADFHAPEGVGGEDEGAGGRGGRDFSPAEKRGGIGDGDGGIVGVVGGGAGDRAVVEFGHGDGGVAAGEGLVHAQEEVFKGVSVAAVGLKAGHDGRGLAAFEAGGDDAFFAGDADFAGGRLGVEVEADVGFGVEDGLVVADASGAEDGEGQGGGDAKG